MPALLRPKYEMVCQSLAAGKSIKDSYISGGFKYVPAAATTFCRRGDIRARVAELVAQRAQVEDASTRQATHKAGLTKEWVVTRLMYLAERALRGEPLLDAAGVQVPGRFSGRPQGAVAARALELLGQTMGIFVQRHELGGPGDFARLSDQELAAKITEDAHAVGMPADVIQAMLEKQGLVGVEQ